MLVGITHQMKAWIEKKNELPLSKKEFCQQTAFEFELQHQLLPESR